MTSRKCAACGRAFRPRSERQKQSYCGSTECQRERRRRWQRDKRRTDPDYRSNQSAAQQRWAERHPDYWREYRRRHPSYAERNRAAAKERQRARRGGREAFAKMDASGAISAVSSGTYQLLPASSDGFAKMDAITVKIVVLSDGYGAVAASSATVCKERTPSARGSPAASLGS